MRVRGCLLGVNVRKSLYRGTVGGVTGSWVRLTQVDGELFGAFWDGTDL